jgi:5-methylcytosine-specific restriction endonuclease McrA
MPNRKLNADEVAAANELLARIRAELAALSTGDSDLLFAFRRKIYKELSYDERDKPMVRRRLKRLKRQEQGGLCPVCNELLPDTYVVLDRFNAADGYTAENTRLIHQDCDRKVQAQRGYA